MSSHSPDVNPVIDAVAGRSLPAAANFGSLAAMAVGAGAFLFGLFGLGDKGIWAWGAFLVGLVFTLSIAQGGIMFAIIQTGTWGRWGRPLKRIAESFAFYLPVGYLMLAVFLIGGIGIYSWNPDTILPGGPVALAPHSPEAIASKPVWLSKGFFIARELGVIGFLILLDFVYLRASLRPDMLLAKKRLGDKAPGWWSAIIGGATDVDATVKSDHNVQSILVPFIAVTYALGWSLFAFDLIMSLAPWWASNMFGAWVFVSSFWSSLAALGLVAMLGRDWLKLGAFIRPNVTHDLGKLMLAGCMFWAYTAFAQLLPIWYTDMPEETEFLMIRMMLPQWSWLAQTVGVMCFVAPFTILLSRGIKKMRWPFAGICSLILVGIFLERTLLVMPSIHLGDDFPVMNFVIVSIGVWVGFVGLMTQVVGRALATLPPLVVSDPYLQPHPWDVHVASLDAHHHH